MIVLLFHIIEHNGKIRQCLIVLSYFIIFRSQTPWFELPVIDEPSGRTREFYKWVRCLSFESGHIFAMPVF